MTAPFLTEQALLTIFEFKHFQGPIMPSSKTVKHQIHFEGLSRDLKMEKNSSTFMDFHGSVATLHYTSVWGVLAVSSSSGMGLMGPLPKKHPYTSHKMFRYAHHYGNIMHWNQTVNENQPSHPVW